jgi:hypothetical protein
MTNAGSKKDLIDVNDLDGMRDRLRRAVDTLDVRAARRILDLADEAGTGPVRSFFLDDMFMTPGGDLTEDDILDLYVYNDEHLVRMVYEGGPLPTYLNKPSFLMPLGSWDPGKKKSWDVLVPMRLARKIDKDMMIMPDVIGTYLLRAVRRSGRI